MVLWEACPLAVGGGWGAVEGVDLILVEREAAEPCRAEPEEAWASEAYLSDRNGSSSRLQEKKKGPAFDFQVFVWIS